MAIYLLVCVSRGVHRGHQIPLGQRVVRCCVDARDRTQVTSTRHPPTPISPPFVLPSKPFDVGPVIYKSQNPSRIHLNDKVDSFKTRL